MKYVDSLADYVNFLSVVKNKKIVILPTFANHEIHYIRNKASLLFVRIIETSEDFVIGITHPDLFSISIEQFNKIEPSEIWTSDQKRLRSIMKCHTINDIGMLYYLLNNKPPELILDAPIHLYYYRQCSLFTDINNIIPVSKHVELHQTNIIEIHRIIKDFSVPQSFFVYRQFLETAYKLESTGLLIDPVLFKTFYADVGSHIFSDNHVYSEYNFYTAAGRPSNRYGNINFAAIDTKNGVRRAFIPRNGNFFLFDFDSFHLNLIAKIIGYKFESDSIHKYLGKYYYDKEELTNDEYAEVKKLNFKYLYGGIPKYIRDTIPFFAQVHKFTYDMWRAINDVGYYESPLTKRRIYIKHITNSNPMKLLNYFVQLIETETTFVIIDKLQKYLLNFKTNLVLYTYDSFLLDYSESDGIECIRGIKNILAVFPTKIYFGKTYHDLIDVTEELMTKI